HHPVHRMLICNLFLPVYALQHDGRDKSDRLADDLLAGVDNAVVQRRFDAYGLSGPCRHPATKNRIDARISVTRIPAGADGIERNTARLQVQRNRLRAEAIQKSADGRPEFRKDQPMLLSPVYSMVFFASIMARARAFTDAAMPSMRDVLLARSG